MERNTQFKFRMYSDGSLESDEWYIDDVCIVETVIDSFLGTESFEQVGAPLPDGWYNEIYSGDGIWVLYDYYSYCDPYGWTSGFWAGADSDENPSWVFDVGMFTESYNLAGETAMTIEFDSNFQDFAGDGEVHPAACDWPGRADQGHLQGSAPCASRSQGPAAPYRYVHVPWSHWYR